MFDKLMFSFEKKFFYVDFHSVINVFVESENQTIGITANCKLHFLFSLYSPFYYQNEICDED